jgi:hypothetical protein
MKTKVFLSVRIYIHSPLEFILQEKINPHLIPPPPAEGEERRGQFLKLK